MGIKQIFSFTHYFINKNKKNKFMNDYNLKLINVFILFIEYIYIIEYFLLL
jgi:hypothetical protein